MIIKEGMMILNKQIIGRDILYNDNIESNKKIILWDVINIRNEQDIIIKFISSNSKDKQGIRIAVDVGNGYIEVMNEKSKGIKLWKNLSPEEIHLKCFCEKGLISIYNIWDKGRGVRSQTDFAGMLVERNENRIIYRCNNGTLDSKFDELVFEIELL